LAKGCYLGFRKMNDSGHGNWIARAAQDGSGKEIYKSLGDLGNLPDHLQFDAAQKAAQAWFKHLGRGGASGITTVDDACERYVRHLRTTKGELAAKDAAARFKNYVLNDRRLAVTELAKLNPARLDAWRTVLQEMPTRSGPRRGERRTDSTLNRDMACFRAALNLSYDEGLVTSDFAWRSKLRPVKNADRRRETYLDRTQRRSFIEKAAPDVADFLYGLALLPLRPGALAALRVGDYDRRLQVLKVGQDKSGRDRKIKLPVATATFLDEASKNKLPGAPLLSRGDGKVWDRHAWKLPVRAAAVAADLPPGTSAYTMRHSVISDLVHDGLDLLTVAQISGTSVAMIERHYGHLRGEIAAEALARLAL
jgi:integrase